MSGAGPGAISAVSITRTAGSAATAPSEGNPPAGIYAMASDTARAESLTRDLNKRYPLDTQMQSLWLPAVRAQQALVRKNPTEALQDLQPADPPIESGQTGFLTNVSCLIQ